MDNVSDASFFRNQIFDFVDREKIQGLIIAGSVGSKVTQERLKAFHLSYSPLPTISINTPIDGITSIVVDNYGGVFKAVNHLIIEHNLKHLAFIKGQLEVPEANDRFQAFSDALELNKIPMERKLVFQGDFNAQSGIDAVSMVPSLTTVRQPVQSLGETAVDTIVKIINGEAVPEIISNLTSLIVRQSCGCNAASIKKYTQTDIQLAGIKSITLENSLDVMISQIVKQAFSFLRMDKIFARHLSGLIQDLDEDIRLSREPSRFLINLEKTLYSQSSQFYQITDWYTALSVIKDYFTRIFNDGKAITFLFDIIHYADIMIGEFNKIKLNINKNRIMYETSSLLTVGFNLISDFNLSHMMNVLKDELSLLEISQCFVVLFKHMKDGEGKNKKKLPKYSRLMMAYDNNRLFAVEESKAQFLTGRLLPEPIKPYQYNIVIDSLCLYDEFFGYIIFNSEPKKSFLYDTLRSNLSIALMGTFLLRNRMLAEEKLKYTLSELEKTNSILENISRRDELTGLLNRRGFIDTGREYHKNAAGKKENYLLFFADLDYLKAINDTFGHMEGDFALQQVSRILKSAFRDSDIIGRIGGDEFTIIALYTLRKYAETILNNLHAIIDMVNNEVNKPYQISISIGVYEYDSAAEKEITFEQVIAEADKLLYLEKKKRKKNNDPFQKKPW